MLSACISSAQKYTSYSNAIALNLYSEALRDSVNIDIFVPNDIEEKASSEFPVIYLLDKQLNQNYQYNIATIDYLSTLQWMPKAVVVGISFPWKVRDKWTTPNASGGNADDLISFMENELNAYLKNLYTISNFNLLIGHSRTAIFSSYALSKKPYFFNGAIASSVSNFDFGNEYQKEVFDNFLKTIPSFANTFFYYYSVGELAYGDLHEPAVDTLNAYLESISLPSNFQWKNYKHKVAHKLTPGVTVSTALSDIFKDYGIRINQCFDIAKASPNTFPEEEFTNYYSSLSTVLGFEIQPSKYFFNSIGSEYFFDHNGTYGENNLDFALKILFMAIEKYPSDFSYYSWIGEIYAAQHLLDKRDEYLNKAIKLIQEDTSLSTEEREMYLEEIEELRK